uniref:MATH domain-containing protein n=1 Tax=Ditylenchus dipsaci TaxID=166011 RepID=A0A915E314_9BILA
MPDFPSCKKVSKQNMIVTMASAKLNWRIEKFKTLLKLTSVVEVGVIPHAYSNQKSASQQVKFKLHQETSEEQMDFCSLSLLKESLDSLQEEADENKVKANIKTEIKVQHIEQSWTIENFSHCYKPYLEHVIKLPCDDKELTWRMKLYPSGDQEDSHEYVKRVWVENIEGKEISMRIHPNPSNSDYVAYLKKSQFYPQIPDDTFTISFEIDVAHEILTTVCDEPLQNLCLSDETQSEQKNTATTAALRLFAVDPAGQHVQLDEGIINKNVHSVVVSSETLLKAMHSDGSLTVECEVEYISKVETVEKIDQQIEKKTF